MVKLLPWDPSENLKTSDDRASYLSAILAHDGHWGGVYALSDIADAMGDKRAVQRFWRDEKSVRKAETRGDVLDFRAVMQAANALGLRLCAGAESCEKSDSCAIGNLNAALARCDAWGAALAMRDIAAAMGAESVVPHPKRGETVDFAVVLDAARALGLRIRAASVAERVGR